MKKLICLILGAVMIICMTGWTTGDIWSPEAFDETVESDFSKTDETVASNDKYELIWRGSDATFDLIDKATGKRWGVTAREEGAPTVDESGMPIKTLPELSSTIVLEYLDMSNNQTGELFSATAARKDGRIVTEPIDNGLRVYYYFDSFEIRIVVDVALQGDRVTFTVDPKLVQENGKYRAVSVRIAPYWCSNLNDDENAYLFYPSGSGAIVSNETTSTAGTTHESQVYGFDAAMQKDTQETTTKEIRLPVFGAVNGTSGVAAIVEDNAEAAHIGVKAGSRSLGFSGVYVRFDLRGHSTNAVQGMNNESTRQEVYAVSLSEKPVTVGFYPLLDENASYSGIADTYRNYLKSTGALTDKVSEESPLNVTFIGGVMIDQSFLGVPYKELVAATTFNQAQQILGELAEGTDAKISAKLLGFGTSGIDVGSFAGGFAPHKNIGSLKELSALNDFSKENGIDLYYDFDLVKLKKSSAGYSTTFDAAYSSLLKVTTVYKYTASSRSYEESTGYKLLKRGLLMDATEKLLGKISKWNLTGVSLESLSQTAYSDCSTQTTEYFTKGGMGKDVVEIFNKVGEKYKLAGEDANAYAAAASDIVYNTPSTSSRQRIFEYDVPFYQMVFKGYVPMTCESINLAVNPEKELLKAVEAGSGLNYTLIADYNNEYIEYQGYYFFGSQYSDISDGIISASNELTDYYKAINGAAVKSHTVLDSGLRVTVFDNGVKAYVNYTDETIATPDGVSVEAKGYVWEK